MSKKKGWIVTLSGDRTIHDVKKDLEKAGFAVGNVLEEIGSISGAGGDDIATKIRGIPGVADVSPDATVDIGPPGSPETW
jgi:hypothetical protein